MVWKILSALSAVCLGTACYFAWANQKALVEERKRETFATANLAEIKDHKLQAEEAKKNRDTQLATVNKDLETAKLAVVDIAAKAQTKEQELAVLKTNLDQVTKIVNDLDKQIKDAGDIPALLPPGRNNRYDYRMDPIPQVGEHTHSILQELGLGPL
jgi:crotonobetainyl-CoA:carnitine CoA-transferase CaiB-like acyl-CoA transferase